MQALPSSVLAVLACALIGCSIPPSDARIGVSVPSENISQWDPVENYMDFHCGGLDCHGNSQRNLIIWGCYGLRIGEKASIGTFCFPKTTDAEYDATYRSLIGLEPNVMSVVVANGGSDPDLLTFVRKARGEENHKGGAVAPQGSNGDVCMTSWLTGTTNTDACTAALDGVDGGALP